MIGSGGRSEEMLDKSQTKLKSGTNLEVLSDFTDKTLEGEFADEELSRLLVPPDFTEGDGSGPEAMGLLDTTSCGLRGYLAQVGDR